MKLTKKKKTPIFLIKIQVYKENTHEHTFHGFGTCTLNVYNNRENK